LTANAAMAQIYATRDGGILSWILVHLLEWDCTLMNYKIIPILAISYLFTTMLTADNATVASLWTSSIVKYITQIQLFKVVENRPVT
jgi:hypothetical protein